MRRAIPPLARDPVERRLGEGVFAGEPCGAQPKRDVFGNGHFGKRREGEAVHDPFPQRQEQRIGKERGEFGLRKEHDLQQFMLRGLQVGEPPYFVERRRRHRVRFVDHDRGALPCLVAGNERRVEAVKERCAR